MTPAEIRQLRESLELTQADFAAWLGITRERVGNLERGAGAQPSITVLRLMDAIAKGYRPSEKM